MNISDELKRIAAIVDGGGDVYGYVIYNGMTDVYWAYCSESELDARKAGRDAVAAIRGGAVEDELASIGGRDGVWLAGEETGDLELDADGEFRTKVDGGAWAGVEVVGEWKSRF